MDPAGRPRRPDPRRPCGVAVTPRGAPRRARQGGRPPTHAVTHRGRAIRLGTRVPRPGQHPARTLLTAPSQRVTESRNGSLADAPMANPSSATTPAGRGRLTHDRYEIASMREVQRVPRDEFRRRPLRAAYRTWTVMSIGRASETETRQPPRPSRAGPAASCVLTVSWSTVCPIF